MNMKRIIIIIIDFIFKQINKCTKLHIYLRYKYFTNTDDHIWTTIEYLKNNYKKSHTIIDIGAANGDTSIAFAKAFPKSKVIAYEPIPHLYNIALKKTSSYKNILLRNIALSDEKGIKSLNVTSNYVSTSLLDIGKEMYDNVEVINKLDIQIDRLDNEISNFEEISLIKIDVQGVEKLVLSSGLDILRNTDLILTEMSIANQYVGGCLYYELDEFLRINRFKLIGLFNKQPGFIEYDALYERVK